MEKESPLVSIIIPCYNTEKYIIQTLESCVRQTYQNWECIIIDDASFDKSVILIETFIKDNPKFHLLKHLHNLGVSSARNTGLDASHGKYILPLDSDDLIDPRYIEMAVDRMEKDSKVSLVYCNAMLFGDKNEPWLLPEYSYQKLLQQSIIFCSAVFRRESYLRKGAYNRSLDLFEDYEFWLRILSKNSKVIKLDENLFFYRKHPASCSEALKTKNKSTWKRIFYMHIFLYFFNLPWYTIKTVLRDVLTFCRILPQKKE